MSSQAIDTATTHFLRFRLQYSSLGRHNERAFHTMMIFWPSLSALLYYDYALTFPREVQYIWKQKFRLSTALYIGCRPMYQDSVVRGLPIFPSVSFEALTHLQCIELVSAPEMLSITTIIFETSSTFFTVIRCIQALRAMKKVERKRYSVVSILLEQGVLFFCSISIFTVTGVILQYRAPPGFFQRLPNAFTLPLSCTLTARFILHLRQWYATHLNDSKDGVKSGSLVFQAQSSVHSETTLTGMVAMEDFGPDPVFLAAANGTNRMELQLTQRENEVDGHCAAGQPCLAKRENEIV
ncbi:hypothetical protein MVEN_00715000 [Mycena venus]|uniref:DUF6533 domain-containing protein n=1 Tax=Mycena venus TaxID=2733690 RepID=A0A8H7D5T4_9AGAR|nr:hypothetical protein MVEN_00715000 [Mycena venus]